MATSEVKGDGVQTAGSGSGADTGLMICFAGGTVPDGWLRCDGAAVSRATYADLFAVIGETWGAGDGTTTFNLPDAVNRMLTGRDTDDVGVMDGENTHVLTIAEMPNHTHGKTTSGSPTSSRVGAPGVPSSSGVRSASGTFAGASTASGSDTGHNNQSPYMVLEVLIKT